MLEADGGGGLPSMVGFVEAAANGSFAISPTGGQALIKAIHDLAKFVDDNLSDTNVATQQPPLGNSNGAKLMKPYMVDVLTDDQGFYTRLKEFRDSLVDAEAAINAAMKNYDNMEHGIQGNFRAV
jgi:hypothetical protein